MILRFLPVLLVGLVVLPSFAVASSPPVDRFAVGFHTLPPGLRVGSSFHGGTIVAVHEAVHAISVESQDPPGFERAARAAPDARYVEPMTRLAFVKFTPDDPGFATQYGPQQIGAPFAWDRTLGASSVHVCVVDTGVRHTHEDLAARYVGGHDYANNDTDPWDDHGHGTHVSGIAVAATDNAKGIAGIAQASLRHAKVLDATGFGTWDIIASGITGCADAGAHIISISIGGDSGATILLDAVDYAWDQGALVVAAAGNDGCVGCVDYPAKYANALAVGCTTSMRTRCAFSSQGPEVDLSAPGDNIQSTYHSSDTAYAFRSGTSMSAPHVAGVAALLKSAESTFTNADLRERLEDTAEDLGAAGLDGAFGHGLVRADRILGTAQSYGGRVAAGAAHAPDVCPFDLCVLSKQFGYDGFFSSRFPVLPAPGRAFALEATFEAGAGDADVCWLDADGARVGACELDVTAQAAGLVPAGAEQAEVFVTLGADATFSLSIAP